MLSDEYVNKAHPVLCNLIKNRVEDIKDMIVKSSCRVISAGQEYRTFEEALKGEDIVLSEGEFYDTVKKQWEESEDGITMNIVGVDVFLPKKSKHTTISCDLGRINHHDIDHLKYYKELVELIC